MTCQACSLADSDPLTGHYLAGCLPCAARAIAQSPQHHASAKAKRLTHDYIERLRAAFGVEWESGHASVKAWAQRIANAGSRGDF